VLESENGDQWAEWLQTHRVELNAMTTPQFIAWLDDKMEAHGVGKLIPPSDVLTVELDERLAAKVRAAVTARILREARADEQIAEALAAIARPDAAALRAGIQQLFEDEPEAEWRDHIETTADELSGPEPEEYPEAARPARRPCLSSLIERGRRGPLLAAPRSVGYMIRVGQGCSLCTPTCTLTGSGQVPRRLTR
jgi:hypothetical protein